ncbi:hypothetical protein ABIE64_000916 [Thalassospira sp. MBR-102]|uniref:hypothetical protein n=1 Tax=Thalassospira sp. MBR-102 TaxID=3156466 RepID=UPI0033949075
MFGQINISNSPADATERYVAATPNVVTNVVDEAKSTAQLEEDIARTRSIIDNIEISQEANERLKSTVEEFDKPVFEFQSSALDVLNLMKPALSDAQKRMNNEAFIVLAMMGIPPEKAREIANSMTGNTPEGLAVSNLDGTNASVSAQELSLNATNETSVISAGGMSIVSQSFKLDLTQLESRFSKIKGSANISISEFRAQIEMIRIEITQVYQKDPLILDLDGDGITTSHVNDNKQFDIDGDGTIDQTAWVGGNDALLALDRNDDGIINDGTELFGDQNGAKDGFAELAKYDDNNDGVIDNKDKVFSSLVLLRADGSQSSLESEGIKSISLTMITPLDQRLIGGDLVAKSQFERDDGTTGTVGEVFFDVRA